MDKIDKALLLCRYVDVCRCCVCTIIILQVSILINMEQNMFKGNHQTF